MSAACDRYIIATRNEVSGDVLTLAAESLKERAETFAQLASEIYGSGFAIDSETNTVYVGSAKQWLSGEESERFLNLEKRERAMAGAYARLIRDLGFATEKVLGL